MKISIGKRFVVATLQVGVNIHSICLKISNPLWSVSTQYTLRARANVATSNMACFRKTLHGFVEGNATENVVFPYKVGCLNLMKKWVSEKYALTVQN